MTVSSPYHAMLLCDFYKISHREQYPEKTEVIYSNWTPRRSRVSGINSVVMFGLQGFIQEYLIDFFNDHFFVRLKEDIVEDYKRIIHKTLGIADPHAQHIEDLHNLGYLPLEIRALAEGVLVPIRVPMFTIHNTDPRFFWLTNYVESLLSCELWQTMTSATLANEYRKLLDRYARDTGGDVGFVQFQGHDFSFRGMGGLYAAAKSGAAHLLSFSGTDTIPGILYLERYYDANVEKELVGTSIPATEHSVMCAHGKDELVAYTHLITRVYPKGFVSIVSDTWDLWSVLNNVIAKLKDTILRRDGRVVIRPDSGDPVKIICGDPQSSNPDARKGVIRILWDIFGGTDTPRGFKQLDSHIGCIYGDAITLDRCGAICEGLKAQGFASTNMVYGIGSYTYQYVTRDTFGFAMKSTLCVIDGKEIPIYKDPVTDSGEKRSAVGAMKVIDVRDDAGRSTLKLIDDLTLKYLVGDGSATNQMQTVFLDGELVRVQTLQEVRARLDAERRAKL